MISQPIVILGGNGMLGQQLASVFDDKRTFVWDKDEMDITDIDEVRQKLEYFTPRIVINAAAYNLVDDAETDEGAAIAQAVNTLGPKNIATVCKEIDATLVHFSTDYVFDGTQQEGYVESDAPAPQSRYAESKAAGEKAVLDSGARAYIIRTCRLFGKPGAAEISKNSFVDTMLKLSEGRDTLDVVDAEVGCPTYAPDLAERVRYILDSDNAVEPGIYHVTNSGSCTWYDFAQEIFKLSGKDVTLNAVGADAFPRAAARPAFSVLNNTKLPPMRSWQEALADYLQSAS